MNEAPRPRACEERVLLLAPTPKDAAMTENVFKGIGVACTACATVEALCGEITGGAGALVLTEHVLGMRGIDSLVSRLRQQPPWSDLPVVILTSGGAESVAGRQAMGMFGGV